MIGAGDLDRRIKVQQNNPTTNGLNEQVDSWQEFISVAARRRDVSDGEKFAAGQVGSSLTARFVIRSSIAARSVTPVDRILHDGKTWSIKGVKEADEGRFRFLEITATKDAD